MLVIKRIELEALPGTTLKALAMSLCDISRRHNAEVTVVFEGVRLTKGVGDGLNRFDIETLFYKLEAEKLHGQ